MVAMKLSEDMFTGLACIICINSVVVRVMACSLALAIFSFRCFSVFL